MGITERMDPDLLEFVGWLRSLEEGPLRQFLRMKEMGERLMKISASSAQYELKAEQLKTDMLKLESELAERKSGLEAFMKRAQDDRDVIQAQLKVERQKRQLEVEALTRQVQNVQAQLSHEQATLNIVKQEREHAEKSRDELRADAQRRLAGMAS